MDLIDIYKHEAAEVGEPIEKWLNGIPITVYPDGTVLVRTTIPVEKSDE
jgi:hypothetical protein